MKREELFRMFADEAGRNLEEMRAILAERKPGPEALQQLYRHLHSVKGMSASLGLDELGRIAHGAEDRVEALRSGSGSGRELPEVREAVARMAALLAELDAEAAPPGAPVPHPGEPPLPRVDLSRVPVSPAHLDRLLDVALELAAAHQRLEHLLGPHAGDRELYALRTQLAGTVGGLRREVLEMRLLPVRELVALLEESLRRWAAEQRRLVALVVRGEAVRVDRAILERLLDPLGHLLRNAVVHGVESPTIRRRQGKPERATIEMSVQREGERLRIDVRDDGRGLAVETLHARLTERGVRLPPLDDPRCEPAILEALGSSGGSSHAAAGRLAGRGVGLSAARAAVERLGGTLSFSSDRGRGFRARLVVPTRVAVIRAFVAESAGESFAIPVGAVREVDDRSPEQVEAVPLGTLLGLDPPRADHVAPRRTQLLLGVGQETVPVTVDEIRGPVELIVRPLGAPLDGAGLPWAGAALLPAGGVALVVDGDHLPARRSVTMRP